MSCLFQLFQIFSFVKYCGLSEDGGEEETDNRELWVWITE